MNSHTQIQNTLNHPPLQPYSPHLDQPTQQVEVGTRSKRHQQSHTTNAQNKQPRKTKYPQPNVLPILNSSITSNGSKSENRALVAVMRQPLVV